MKKLSLMLLSTLLISMNSSAAIVTLNELGEGDSPHDTACVYLPFGVGYAAKMYAIGSDGFTTPKSETFSVFQTKCISLEGASLGSTVTIYVEPQLGKDEYAATCKPVHIVGPEPTTVNYQAWGTNLNPFCG